MSATVFIIGCHIRHEDLGINNRVYALCIVSCGYTRRSWNERLRNTVIYRYIVIYVLHCSACPLMCKGKVVLVLN
jgi:hypothetical protein